MKKGKEHGEQISSLGPMFPRLHVNDAADKGGPRAPPRNKMALYEQLSIPSQRFNPRLLPLSRNGATNLVSPASSSQGSGRDRCAVYPLRLPHSAPPTHLSEKVSVNKSNTAQPSTSSSLMKSRKRARAEGEFTVPVYVRLSTGLGRGHSGTNRNTSDHSVKIQNASNRHLSQDSHIPEVLDKQTGYSDRLRHDHLAETDKETGSRQRRDTRTGEVPRIPADDSCDLSRERTRVPLLVGVRDRGGDVSETSMIYSVPASDISPDDVVGIIGQKQFWKARKALVNQQRVFAVQVFELHRLIKVQRLIAESPHLLLEDLSLTVPSSDKLTIEMVKPTARDEHKDDPKKQGHRVEQSAGDGVLKISVSSVVRSHHPRAGDSHLVPPDASDNNVSDFWAYHQQAPKHQWLIPVMSPSEGLVYKPYPGPAYLGPYNGQGPTPFMGSFVGPPYGVPSRFPSYGAPISGPEFSGSSVEQIHQFHQRPEEDSDMNMLQQSSCNDPRPKSRMAPPEKFRESEVQGSTGSNLSERPAEGVRGVLPLFPTIPPIAGGGSGTCESSQQPTRVIKVVPHNRRSASESAARIFRSIQEERKLYE